jgi:hypothetical protein
MGLGIRITQLTPVYPTKVFLQWDLDNPTESGSYTFAIQRSGSSEGPWETLRAGAPNIFNYVDDLTNQPQYGDDEKVHLYSLQKQIYYRVTVVPPSGCVNQATSDPHCIRPELVEPWLAGLRRRLRYDEDILFRKFNGVPLVILKRRRWGDRCTECYDAVTQSILKEHCTECYGTGFKLGYWSPVTTWGRIYPPHNIDPQTTPRDKRESSQQLITLLDIPLLEDNDLIIERDANQRFCIRRQTQTELKRRSVHQQVTGSLIERGAVEYEIPVDFRAAPPII